MSGIIIKRIPDYNRNFIEYTPLLASKQHLMAITTFLSTLRSESWIIGQYGCKYLNAVICESGKPS